VKVVRKLETTSSVLHANVQPAITRGETSDPPPRFATVNSSLDEFNYPSVLQIPRVPPKPPHATRQSISNPLGSSLRFSILSLTLLSSTVARLRMLFALVVSGTVPPDVSPESLAFNQNLKVWRVDDPLLDAG